MITENATYRGKKISRMTKAELILALGDKHVELRQCYKTMTFSQAEQVRRKCIEANIETWAGQ